MYYLKSKVSDVKDRAEPAELILCDMGIFVQAHHGSRVDRGLVNELDLP